jgi:hypothetical protein
VKDDAAEMVRAHTTLCLFGAIEALAESSDLYGRNAQLAAYRIIRICRQAQKRELVTYDRCREKVAGRRNG